LQMLQNLTVDLLGRDVSAKSGIINDVNGLISNVSCFCGLAGLIYHQASEEGLFGH